MAPADVPPAVARAVVDAVAREAGALNRDPDREFSALREDLAAYLGHGLTAERVWRAIREASLRQAAE